MTASNRDGGGLHAVGREHGSGAGDTIWNGNGEIGLAARLQAGLYGREPKSARQHFRSDQGILTHQQSFNRIGGWQ
jgi:hypothetical protein